MARLLVRRALASLAAVALSASLGACQDNESLVASAAPAPAPTASTSSTPQVKAPRCDGLSRSAVVTNLAFTRVNPPGVAPGFDLDQRVSSDKTDDASCRKVDFTDPEGRLGIDNQIAALLPDIEALVGNAVDGLVQGAINDGLLLLMLDFEGLDDLQSDACFGVNLRLGEGKPTLGTNGVIEGFQTFTLKPDGFAGHGDKGTIDKGLMTVGPMDMAIPLKLFDVTFTLQVYNAYFRFKVDEEGYLDGYLGGGIVPEELVDGIKEGAGLDDILPLVLKVLKGSADLAPDAEGDCRQVSVALTVKAAPAFIAR